MSKTLDARFPLVRALITWGWIAWMVLGLSHFASAQELRLAVSPMSPYVIPEGEQGIELDIIRGALPPGTKIKFVYLPFSRMIASFTDGTVDAMSPVTESAALPGAFFSTVHVTYQNVAISLKSRGLKIGSIADLGKLRIVAFQKANLYLGKDFAAMARANSKYDELSSLENMIKMMYSGRVDVIVLDIAIYKDLKSKIKDVDVSQQEAFAELFPINEYKVAFKSRETAAAFNDGLAKLKSSGKYAAILHHYIP
ncbi:substrate-binding periplasmic protein [Rhodoferax lacus]|nr:transporter substrate-binding domain-containing protein [Rhodoferax lacus]